MYLSSDPDVGVGVVVDRRLEKIILSHNAACPQNIVDHFNILPQNLATTSVQKVQQANRDIIISIGKPMGVTIGRYILTGRRLYSILFQN